MILLERKAPKSIERLNSLLRRLPPNDSDFSYLNESLYRVKVGYEGEKTVDREWMDMPFLGKHYLMFNFETTDDFGFIYQIDTICLTPNFIILLEIKNISGEVHYDDQKFQFIRIKDGEKKTLRNPYTQLNRNMEFIEKILSKMKLELPIERAIVMANSNTVIGDVLSYPPLFHANGLKDFVKECKLKHPKRLISENQLDKLVNYILSLHQPVKYDLNIGLSRIRKGVLCENCYYQVQMKYKNGVWSCPKCGTRSKTAFYQALNDYQLIIGDKITNREFREFFGVESICATTKILNRLKFKHEGINRYRYYIIPEDILTRAKN